MYDVLSHDLSMTEVECTLKQIMSLYPDLKSRILSAEELTTLLIGIKSNTHAHPNVQFNLEDVARFPNITRPKATSKFFNGSIDANDLSKSPVARRETHSESEEILAEYDISVGRMLRYFPANWHINDCFEIYYALSGTCPVYFHDEVINVRPGTVLVIAPSVLHATPCYSDDSVLLYYLIRTSTFERIFWNNLPSNNLMSTFFRQALNSHQRTAYLHFESDNDSDISSLLYRIYQEYCNVERYSAQMINALMSEFFVLLLRRYEGTARLPRRSDFFWKHEFSAILTYIQTNFITATQADVAKEFHYSERQIGRIVQSCTGLSYTQLILKLRMEQAVKLLQRNNSTIDNIAAAVGYSSPCSFYRAFSKYFGQSPRTYSAQSST